MKKSRDESDQPKRVPMTRLKPAEWKRNFSNGVYKKIDGYFPHTIANRIIKKYKKKNVNDAFSEYCKKVGIEQQQQFWDLFERTAIHSRKAFRRRFDYWFIDKDSNIQRYKAKIKHAYRVYSHDYREGIIDLHTGKEAFPDAITVANKRYSTGIVEGEVREFEHRGPDFFKYSAEQEDKSKKKRRAEEERAYTFKHDHPLKEEES